MKILIVGGGGREHTLVWKIVESPKAEKVYCAPGNAGIAGIAECVNIAADDIKGLMKLVEDEGIDLTVVGPELPLTLGIVDDFTRTGLRIFGPTKATSAIEGSKVFAKSLMKKYGIPTADFEIFDSAAEAREYIESKGAPIVIKADGLAAGKGAIVAQSVGESLDAVKLVMEERAFGDAGNKIVVEQFLEGEEASFIAFTDGTTILPLPSSQDHKAIFDGDQGPNTGGMGAYSPAPLVTEEMHRKVIDQIMIPTVRAMESEGYRYKGMLYAGLMINEGQPRVLEFNGRFGDPETQAQLIRMKSDLVPVLEAVIDERLEGIEIEWDKRAAVCVVMASQGYPGSYEKGKEISGLEKMEQMKDVVVFHAGTTQRDGKFYTNGGRVLGVTGLGEGIKESIERTYQAVELISWEGAYYRKDIGRKALKDKKG
ncbi:MAG: phosphoribosylamine--glycine ligase [Deltaproteobacteria bacterium]|nr:MAG: phosphoribosylamine--glycine ligase [Deltaproteobacteria bacterium]